VNPVTWIRDAREYLSEVQVEWKKITWPAQQEALVGTVSVVVVVTIITTVLGFVDYGLSIVMQAVLQ
jgi:preprotein translocase subunit SecE